VSVLQSSVDQVSCLPGLFGRDIDRRRPALVSPLSQPSALLKIALALFSMLVAVAPILAGIAPVRRAEVFEDQSMPQCCCRSLLLGMKEGRGVALAKVGGPLVFEKEHRSGVRAPHSAERSVDVTLTSSNERYRHTCGGQSWVSFCPGSPHSGDSIGHRLPCESLMNSCPGRPLPLDVPDESIVAPQVPRVQQSTGAATQHWTS
jgi:hypothetical protein